ncbi:MAG: outer membrane protein assembly factor BamB family protein [Armatimonadota bacterium]
MRAFGLALALFTASLALQAADWPQFRGLKADGYSPETTLNFNWQAKPPQQLWRVAMTDNGFSGPSVVGNMVYIMDHQDGKDLVRAINLTTGKDVWGYTYDDPAKENWGFTRSTPTVANGKVYTLSRTGILCCFEAAKGTVLWWKNIRTDYKGAMPGWGYATSPVVDGKKLIVTPGGPNALVVALDKDTGAQIWAGGGSDGAGYATPVIATINGKRQYLIFAKATLAGVDANTGALLWSFPWKTGCDVNGAMPIIVGNSVFITSGYGHGCAVVDIGANGATLRWENKLIVAHFSSPVYANGYVYGNSDAFGGSLVCVELATGKEMWHQAGFEKGGLMAVGNLILAMAGNGGRVALVKITPQGYQEVGQLPQLGGANCWTAPVIANGKLLIRNKMALFCYDL